LLTLDGKLGEERAVFVINLVKLAETEDVDLAGATPPVLEAADFGTAEPESLCHLLGCKASFDPMRAQLGSQLATARGVAACSGHQAVPFASLMRGNSSG
jgi:hypothetical protein